MEKLIGETYSLHSDDGTSDDFYKTIAQLASQLMHTMNCDERYLLKHIQTHGNRRLLNKLIFRSSAIDSEMNALTIHLHSSLAIYTQQVQNHLSHLKKISIAQCIDPTLRTKEYQYHLYMLEIELINRINKKPFRESAFKMALLPHCLRDFRERCLSIPGDIEHVCKGCTKDCFINSGSAILKKYGVNPYISVTIDQRKLLKQVKQEHRRVGVLGIACVPELAQGMRLCQSLDIPVIGVPLDANRCVRWMGQAHESRFNITALENLLQ